MSVATKFLPELHYTPAEVEAQATLREMYWQVIHLLVESGLPEERQQEIGYDALLAWFHNDAAALATIREQVE